ncbi:MAG: EutN/CcmL family microcompartment protein [Bacillota bacterium]
MYLGKVVGNVVSTRKDDRLTGAKLLIIRYMTVDDTNNGFKDGHETIVAVDTVGAGTGDIVLLVIGSSATRNIEGFQNTPTDVTIVGIVDDAKLES